MLPIKTFKVKQNNQGFLLGIFKMSELRRFVKFTQRIVLDYDEVTNKPIYNDEVQRKVSPSKIDSIADFLIHDSDAFFPTNIVVAIPTIAIDEIQEEGNIQTVILKDFVAIENNKADGDTYLTIIDGQHRVAGIEKAISRIKDENRNLELSLRSSKSNEQFILKLKRNNELLKKLDDFEIIVTFFIDPTPEYQAMIFSTINRTQTKVSEDLVFSLFGLSKNDSPQKTALEVVLALNASDKSALFDRIKLTGAKYKYSPPLSQSTAVKSILYQISPNLKKAEIEKTKPRSYVLSDTMGLVFRKYYGNNEDANIVRIINLYFKAVREVFLVDDNRSLWDLDAEFNILHTTVAYQALFLILVDLVRLADETNRFQYNYYLRALMAISDIDVIDDNYPKKYPLTSKSINVLYNDMASLILGEKFHPRKVD